MTNGTRDALAGLRGRGQLSTMAVQSMTDDELHGAHRDYTAVADHLARIAGLCSNRAKAILSVMSKRANARSQGRETVPSKPKEGAGALDLVRPLDEDVSFGDHAVMRYLERVHGIDLTAIRNEMKDAYQHGDTMAGGAIVVSDGNCFLRTKRGFVKTMMPLEWLREEDIAIAVETYERD